MKALLMKNGDIVPKSKVLKTMDRNGKKVAVYKKYNRYSEMLVISVVEESI